jgi:Flp pilus assembly protein TadG
MLTAMLMMAIIPMVGLAVDAGVLFAVKAKLSSAVDASAIAAARSLSVGLTIDEQRTSAENRAKDFFRANFPSGNWWARNPTAAVEVKETATRTRTVFVTGEVVVPQMFMRYVGFDTVKVRAEGKASRRDVNLMIVLDRSYSMRDDVAPGKPCTVMKTESKRFVNMFAESRDRLGLITYGAAFVPAFEPNTIFRTGANNLPSKIDLISCDSNTGTSIALMEAYNRLKLINEPGALNLIVIFTDGVPNGIRADFPIKTRSDDRYGYPSPTSAPSCTSDGTECHMPPSLCKDSMGNTFDRNLGSSVPQYGEGAGGVWNPNWTPLPVHGVLAQWAGGKGLWPTGTTAGLMKPQNAKVNDGDGLASFPAGCEVAGSGERNQIRRDVAYIPDTDHYGLSTSGYKTPPVFTSGPYVGKPRPDVPMTIVETSMNLTDNAAKTMRADSTYQPIIYAIGLGDVDHELLYRISNMNDPANTSYDKDKPEGLYVYAPTTTDLNYAFSRIASEILRISQ